MEFEKVKRKIDDISEKAPLEAGVVILVYNILDSVLDCEKYSLIAIDRLWTNRDNRLTPENTVADLAIVSSNFVYNTKGEVSKGEVYGLIEIKCLSDNLEEDTSQIKAQRKGCKHHIYTNGIEWKYYRKYERENLWTLNLCDVKEKKFEISENKYNELLKELKSINWEKDNI